MSWFRDRVRERSTWAGVAAIIGGIATVAGKPEIADGVNEYLPLILTVIGGVLVGKSSEPEDKQGILPMGRR